MDPLQRDPDRITYFAETDARGKQTRFGIKAKDRSKHMYVIGKTGMGKSTLLENMAIQDIQNGEGIVFIDPHGGTAEKLLDYVPEERVKDVLYFAPFDMEHPISFNVMEDVGYDSRHLVVSGLMSAFKKIWVDAWSARMEYILSNTLLALLEYPDSTLLDVNRMYTSKAFRKKVVENIKDPLVKSFWVDEFAGYSDRYTQEATPAIQNKVGQFTSNPLVRNIVGQPKSTFDLREMMDNRKIFIVNLSKGRMGETNAQLLGSMLTTKIYLAAMSRADLPAHKIEKLPNSYFYVDEFQSVANDSFADILSEARKYKLNLILAHQYVEQMEENVRNAVFGNVGTTIAFRVGPFDAESMATIFKPHFEEEDLVNLGFAQIYLTLMIDGVGSKPFSATTLAPIEAPQLSYRDQIIAHSRSMHARDRTVVEKEITDRSQELSEEDGKVKKKDSNSTKKSSSPAWATSPPPTTYKPVQKTESKPGAPKASSPKESAQSTAPKPETRPKDSLKDVVKDTQKKDQSPSSQADVKATSPDAHLKELRSTLSRIAGDASQKKVNKTPPSQKPKPRPVSVPPKEKQPSTPEVPEKVLRDVLDTDKK